MTPEAQRIAIAEWCGWTVERKVIHGHWVMGILKGAHVPDYPNDLNLIHEAEKELEHPEAFAARLGAILLRDKSASNMDGTTAWHFAFAHATAAQRAEALLRTIGKWIE